MTHDDPTPQRPSDPISPSDPRLTAYAFGELEGEDLALIEAALANDETLRAAVDGLRAFGGTLTDSLAVEIADENKNDSAVSKTIAVTPALAPADKAAFAKRSSEPKRRGALLRFPFALSYLAPALAACLAVVFWIQHDNGSQRERAVPASLAFNAENLGDASSAPVARVAATETDTVSTNKFPAPGAPADAQDAPAESVVSAPVKAADTSTMTAREFAAIFSFHGVSGGSVRLAPQSPSVASSVNREADAIARPKPKPALAKAAAAGRLVADSRGNYDSEPKSWRHDSVVIERAYFQSRLFRGAYIRTTAIPSPEEKLNRESERLEDETQRAELKRLLQSATSKWFFMLDQSSGNAGKP